MLMFYTGLRDHPSRLVHDQEVPVLTNDFKGNVRIRRYTELWLVHALDCDLLGAGEWPGSDDGFDAYPDCRNAACLVTTYCGRHRDRAAVADAGRQEAALRARRRIQPGQVIVSLRANTVPAAWPRSDRATFGSPLHCQHC